MQKVCVLVLTLALAGVYAVKVNPPVTPAEDDPRFAKADPNAKDGTGEDLMADMGSLQILLQNACGSANFATCKASKDDIRDAYVNELEAEQRHWLRTFQKFMKIPCDERSQYKEDHTLMLMEMGKRQGDFLFDLLDVDKDGVVTAGNANAACAPDHLEQNAGDEKMSGIVDLVNYACRPCSKDNDMLLSLQGSQGLSKFITLGKTCEGWDSDERAFEDFVTKASEECDGHENTGEENAREISHEGEEPVEASQSEEDGKFENPDELELEPSKEQLDAQNPNRLAPDEVSALLEYNYFGIDASDINGPRPIRKGDEGLDIVSDGDFEVQEGLESAPDAE